MTWRARKQKLGRDLRDAQLTTAAADYGGMGVSPRRARHDPRSGRAWARAQPAAAPADAPASEDRARGEG